MRLPLSFVFPLGDKQTFKEGGDAVAVRCPNHHSQWLPSALNRAIYDVKWDYEGYRTTARIALFFL